MARKNTRPKPRKDAWFVPVRGSYLPASWQGWLTYLPFVAYLVFTLVYAVNWISSLAQAILFIVPNFVAAAAVMTWVAKRMS